MNFNKDKWVSRRWLGVIFIILSVFIIGAIGLNTIAVPSFSPEKGVTEEVYVKSPALNTFNVFLKGKELDSSVSRSLSLLDAQWVNADQLTNKKILAKQNKLLRLKLNKQMKYDKSNKNRSAFKNSGFAELGKLSRLPGQTELEYNEANAPVMFPKDLSNRMEHLLRMVEQDKRTTVSKDTYNLEKYIAVKASAYVADCYGCSGITSTGVDVRKDTPNIIAVDPSVIPLGTKVDMWVNGVYFGVYTANDVGGAIKGNRVDMLIETRSAALRFGMRDAILRIRN